MRKMRQVKVSDLVHYYISDEPRAAIVTEVREENICSLAIFYPNSISFAAYCNYSALRTPGTWCFPEDAGGQGSGGAGEKLGEFSDFPQSELAEKTLPPAPLPPCPPAPLLTYTPF